MYLGLAGGRGGPDVPLKIGGIHREIAVATTRRGSRGEPNSLFAFCCLRSVFTREGAKCVGTQCLTVTVVVRLIPTVSLTQ
jgi:hypothetical protein